MNCAVVFGKTNGVTYDGDDEEKRHRDGISRPKGYAKFKYSSKVFRPKRIAYKIEWLFRVVFVAHCCCCYYCYNYDNNYRYNCYAPPNDWSNDVLRMLKNGVGRPNTAGDQSKSKRDNEWLLTRSDVARSGCLHSTALNDGRKW